jgi:hypothetical protein
MKRFWLILATLLGLAATSIPASADLVYTLDVDSDFSTGHNFGTVTLSQAAGNTTNVTVTVQLNTTIAGIGFANTTAGYAIAWDLNGGVPDLIAINAATPNPSSFAVQTTSGSYFGDYKGSPFTSGANGNGFNYAIDYTGATGTSNNLLVFDVTRSAGLALSDFIGNPNYRFAVDIITTAGGTRNVAVRVPEPRTWALFFAGLVGLTVLRRRRKLAKAA